MSAGTIVGLVALVLAVAGIVAAAFYFREQSRLARAAKEHARLRAERAAQDREHAKQPDAAAAEDFDALARRRRGP